METILVLVGWYSIGLGTAWAMARAGHDPALWVLVGWIGGGWAPVAAAGYLLYRRLMSLPPASEGSLGHEGHPIGSVREIGGRPAVEPTEVRVQAA